MMEDFVLAALINTEERNLDERRRLRRLRDQSNPFELDEVKFKKLFRIPPAAAKFVVDQLKSHPQLNEADLPPTHLMILTALHFYADGSYQAPVGADSILSLSQPSVSRALEATTNAIVERLAPIYIKFPTTTEDKLVTKRDFFDIFGFPNALGAVDGSHVAIFKPPLSDPEAPGSLFYNRKGFYSINCQVVVNAKGKITSINPNFPGSTHDAAIWRSSALANHLEREYISGQEEQWLLGDKGYPILPWLMIPQVQPRTEAERNYNATHASARNIVELTFGRMKNKFRCIHRHRTLHYKPKKAAKIITACCTIFNMFNDVISDDDDDLSQDNDGDDSQNTHGEEDTTELDYLALGRAKRDYIIRNYF